MEEGQNQKASVREWSLSWDVFSVVLIMWEQLIFSSTLESEMTPQSWVFPLQALSLEEAQHPEPVSTQRRNREVLGSAGVSYELSSPLNSGTPGSSLVSEWQDAGGQFLRVAWLACGWVTALQFPVSFRTDQGLLGGAVAESPGPVLASWRGKTQQGADTHGRWPFFRHQTPCKKKIRCGAQFPVFSNCMGSKKASAHCWVSAGQGSIKDLTWGSGKLWYLHDCTSVQKDVQRHQFGCVRDPSANKLS